MLYTKPMIDQVFQIRKVAPDHIRAQIKLADPRLLDFMVELYWQFDEKALRDHIRLLMSLAGPTWVALLQENPALSSQNRRVYRGREAAPDPRNPDTPQIKEKAVIYRGQVVQVSS